MKILIINLHSARNLGDDAIMRSTLAAIRAWRPEAEITASANDPGSWRKHADVRVTGSFTSWAYQPHDGGLSKRRWLLPLMFIGLPFLAALRRTLRLRIRPGTAPQRELLGAYYDADLVLSCGGGNFYSHKQFSPFLMLGLLALVFPAWLGKRVIMLPQSFGPIEGRLQRWAARYAFSRARLIMAREAISVRFLEDALRVKTTIRPLPDLAFDLECEGERGEKGPSLRVGVTVIDREQQHRAFERQGRYEEALVELCAHLASRHAAQVTLFCQVTGPTADQDDRRAAAQLAAALAARGIIAEIAAGYADSREVITACAGLDLMIASRMHSAIFALLCGTPTVAIAYQPKAIGMMAGLKLEQYCLAIEDVTREGLIERAEAALAERESIRAAALRGVEEFRKQLAGWPGLVTEA